MVTIKSKKEITIYYKAKTPHRPNDGAESDMQKINQAKAKCSAKKTRCHVQNGIPVRHQVIELKHFPQKDCAIEEDVVQHIDGVGNAQLPFALDDGGQHHDAKAQGALDQHEQVVALYLHMLHTLRHLRRSHHHPDG